MLGKLIFLGVYGDAGVSANIEDSDQTAPKGAVWSGSTLFSHAILSLFLFLEIFTVNL